MVESITEETDHSRTYMDAEYVVGRLNRKLTGWANYFCLGPVSPTYRAINCLFYGGLRVDIEIMFTE
jgi:RNA-directed DNA polymerase